MKNKDKDMIIKSLYQSDNGMVKAVNKDLIITTFELALERVSSPALTDLSARKIWN